MKNLTVILFSVLLTMTLFVVTGCEKDNDFNGDRLNPNDIDRPVDTEFALGYTGEDDLSSVPTSTNFGFSNGNLPSSMDLTSKFPPIGDQGQFGTCVAWAVGYNVKTAISGMNQGLSPSQLAASTNQFSPKDLFTAIPDNQKGSDCGGTGFTPALDVLQNRGIAKMSTVPYDLSSGCSQNNLQSEWSAEANDNKIEYWRKIEASVVSIKQNIANNVPVILGAKLADNFMSWNSETVLSSSSSTANVGQHAYHALVIAGYDDGKGQNGAFKVINSWGENWGAQGYIWIDYNYMINEFCVDYNGDKPLFIAADGGGASPNDNNPPTIVGQDIAPWVFGDYSNYQQTGDPTSRQIEFNIYNIGDDNISPNPNWSFHYLYFDPYNINDYGIIFGDHFDTSVAPNTYGWTGEGFSFNYNIPSGSSFMETVWGISSNVRDYQMPAITGYYYLALIADSYDTKAETNEMNNIFFTTEEPVYFEEGYNVLGDEDSRGSDNTFAFENETQPTVAKLKKSTFNSAVNNTFTNAYTKEEINAFFKKEYENGNMQQRLEASALQRSTYQK